MSTGSSSYPPTGSLPFARLMEVLVKYVSVRTSLTLLNKSLSELGLSPDTMMVTDLPEVIETMMPGLRAFCAEAQINDLVLDLSSLASVRSPSGVTRRPDSVFPPSFGGGTSSSSRPISGVTIPPAPRAPSASGSPPSTTAPRSPSTHGPSTSVTDALSSRRRR